jgi:hypothetical protein
MERVKSESGSGLKQNEPPVKYPARDSRNIQQISTREFLPTILNYIQLGDQPTILFRLDAGIHPMQPISRPASRHGQNLQNEEICSRRDSTSYSPPVLAVGFRSS